MNYFEKNKQAWEEAFEHRHKNWGDDNYRRLLTEELPFFDENVVKELKKIEFKEKNIAQFCCNNGRELLSLMSLGAKSGVGFDIADNILAQAKNTAEKANIKNCEFVTGNILDISHAYHGQFDFIFFTIGAITWFEDLEVLFKKVTACLRADGVLLIHDFHPFMNMLALPGEEDFNEEIKQVSYSYFRAEPWIETEGMGYMSENYSSKEFISFSHTMAAIVTSLAKNNLKITKLEEFDYDVGLSDVYDKQGFPLSFLVTAQKIS